MAKVHEEPLVEEGQEPPRNQGLGAEGEQKEPEDLGYSQIGSAYPSCNDSRPRKDLWAKRPKIADRKRSALPLHVENALNWKWAVLNTLKEIPY